jgi:hypothetical protein
VEPPSEIEEGDVVASAWDAMAQRGRRTGLLAFTEQRVTTVSLVVSKAPEMFRTQEVDRCHYYKATVRVGGGVRKSC